MEFWEYCGLIKFSYSSPANSIPLCPNCYDQYTSSSDPGFVFFPTDLKFFIDYELRDRQRRHQGGIRKVPSASDYKDHQVREHKVSPLALGGLYRRVFLKEYLHGGTFPLDLLRMFTSDKAWHGDPIATLRRGIYVLGSARVKVLDASTIDQLHQLRYLYFSDYVSPRLPLLYRHKAPSKRPHDDLENENEKQNKRRCFLQDSTSDISQNYPASNLTNRPQSSNVNDISA